MPVNSDQFQVTPYTSTVPLVQIPQNAIESASRPAEPLQGNVLGKGTGALAIGDSLLKGFMAGHQQKVQQKAAQAQATINAADAASEASYQEYQNALTKAGGNQNDPAAKAAYDSYIQTFNAGKQAKAQFVIPEKTPKGQSGQQKKGEKGEKKTGWNNFKDFFEANPHIVPQIALMTMQPKPPGLSPQGQESVQNLESTRLANEQKQRQLQNEKTYQDGFATFAHLSPDEVSSLPPETKKGYDAWVNARAALTPMKFSGTPQTYRLPNGKLVKLYKEEAEQYYPDAELYVPGQEAKPGTPGFFLKQYAAQLKKDVNDLTPEEIETAMGQYRASQTPQTSTTSTSTTDTSGNRTTTTKRTAAPGPITKPPTASAAPAGDKSQGITPPPKGTKAASTGITRPPGMSKETWQTMQVTRQAVKAQQEGYQKAEAAYTKAVTAADAAYAKAISNGSDQATAQAAKDKAYARAKSDLDDAKASVATEYDQAVKSVGGTPGDQDGGSQPIVKYYQGHAYVQDPQTGQWNLQQNGQ